jgi:hypothetical protein
MVAWQPIGDDKTSTLSKDVRLGGFMTETPWQSQPMV